MLIPDVFQNTHCRGNVISYGNREPQWTWELTFDIAFHLLFSMCTLRELLQSECNLSRILTSPVDIIIK